MDHAPAPSVLDNATAKVIKDRCRIWAEVSKLADLARPALEMQRQADTAMRSLAPSMSALSAATEVAQRLDQMVRPLPMLGGVSR